LSYAYRQDLNWLVTDFTTRVADVAHAVVVSADGVPLALSEHIPHQFAEQLAAITSGLTSLMAGAARIFEAGQPTLYTRTLSPRLREGSQVVGGLALGDAFRVTPNFQLQYGLRLDANRFLTSPAENAVVRSAFGVSNDALPDRLYVSPRVGFSWTYGTAPQIPGFDGAIRGPRAVVRGGLG